MIQDINIQHELLKTALSATDIYLGIESKAVEGKSANAVMLKDFINSYNIAWKALESLGVLNQHEEYMKGHLKTVWSMAKEEDSTLADDPYAESSGSSGGMDESKISTVLSFTAYLLEEKNEELVEFSEDDINEMVDSLEWEDIVDLYPEEDLEIEEQLEEKISAASRLKRRQSFRRGKNKRNIAKTIRLRRSSTPQQLKSRAMSAARRSMYARMLKGRNKASLSASEKDRMEAQVGRMKNITAVVAMRMVPKLRSLEQKRLAHKRGGK
jgi:hypothetical protein